MADAVVPFQEPMSSIFMKFTWHANPHYRYRQDYLEVAQQTGTPKSTADKWVRAMCSETGSLEKVEHGRYRKKNANS